MTITPEHALWILAEIEWSANWHYDRPGEAFPSEGTLTMGEATAALQMARDAIREKYRIRLKQVYNCPECLDGEDNPYCPECDRGRQALKDESDSIAESRGERRKHGF